MAISHKYTLMCDEVRREDNGKLLLIGLYFDAILLSQIPAPLPGLTFLVKTESDRPGMWSMKMRLEHLDSGERLVQAMGNINFQRPGPALNPIRIPPIQFKAPGVYHFVMEIEGQAEPILYEFSVGLQISQPPTGAPTR